MAVQIAKPNDMMMRDPLKGPMYQPTPTQQQKPTPSAAAQFGQMAQERAMNSALDKGGTMVDEKIMQPAGEALTGMFSSTAPTAASTIGSTGMGNAAVLGAEVAAPTVGAGVGAGAGTGAMATMGAAVPYVGAALLADEVLGLGLRESVLGFDKGGRVGPLYAASGASTDYNYIKSRIDKLQSDRETLDLSDADDESIAIEINKLMDELYKSDGGQVKPTYAAMGLGPLAMKKMKEEGMPMGMGLASMLSEGGEARGVEQQLETGKRQDMSKGPLGLLDMFVKGIDALTGYDRANEKRADLPEGKRDMLINKRKNPYTGEYPITEEEYQRVISEGMTEAVQENIHPIFQPGYFEQGGTASSFQDQLAAWKAKQMDEYLGEKDKIESEIVQSRYKYGGGMAGPLSKVEYKSAGGETYKLSYGGPISKGA